MHRMFAWGVVVAMAATPAFATKLLECGTTMGSLVPPPTFGDGPYDAVRGKPDPIRSSSRSDAFILATGIDTTLVRQIPKDPAKQSYCVKTYDSFMKFGLEVQGFKILEDLYGEKAEKSPDAFAVMQVELASVPNILFLPDVRGRSLEKVLADSRVDGKVKEALREAYQRGLADFQKRTEKAGATLPEPGTKDDLPTYGCQIVRNDRQTRMSVRADQIVVTFDPADPMRFRLTLVDPL